MRQVLPVGRPTSVAPSPRRRWVWCFAETLLAVLMPLVLTACGETDAWLYDSSRIGRWERTPTTVPILTRISSIEGPDDEFVEIGMPTAQDLVPEIEAYRIGPGDVVSIVIYDLPKEGDQTPYERLVDSRGVIVLPQAGEVKLNGLTVEGAKAALAASLKDLLAEPIVDVQVKEQRQLRFSVLGGVSSPGPYFIPEPDYRLLEALTAAGGFSEATQYIYIIRQIPLSAEAGGEPGRAKPAEGAGAPKGPSGESLINIIEDLSKKKKDGQPAGGGGGSPGVFEGSQPASPQPASGQPATAPPPIELIEPGKPAPAAEAPSTQPAGDSSWMFLNGEWVMVKRTPAPRAPGAPEGPDTLGTNQPAEQLVTQRVIKVPVQPLVTGDARYNIVVRPGDVVRVPPAPAGQAYVGGDINRPGAYQLADKLTLSSLIMAAGGIAVTGIPERVDLTRMLGEDRQATIRLNLRAIYERTQPDVFIRANDQINVGTNFWATPLAILRNGIRWSYGFGLVVDRNFSNELFGVQSVNQIGQ